MAAAWDMLTSLTQQKTYQYKTFEGLPISSGSLGIRIYDWRSKDPGKAFPAHFDAKWKGVGQKRRTHALWQTSVHTKASEVTVDEIIEYGVYSILNRNKTKISLIWSQ